MTKNPAMITGVSNMIPGKKLHNRMNTTAGNNDGFDRILLPCISMLIKTA
ncbi:MAG: hypothetical protein ACHQFW_04610 [Chitinophagales bacterium]